MTKEEIADYKQRLRDATSKRKTEVRSALYWAQSVDDTRKMLERQKKAFKDAEWRAEQAGIAEVNLRAEIQRRLREAHGERIQAHGPEAGGA